MAPNYRDIPVVKVPQGSNDLPDDHGGLPLSLAAVAPSQVSPRDQVHRHVEVGVGQVDLLSMWHAGVTRPARGGGGARGGVEGGDKRETYDPVHQGRHQNGCRYPDIRPTVRACDGDVCT